MDRSMKFYIYIFIVFVNLFKSYICILSCIFYINYDYYNNYLIHFIILCIFYLFKRNTATLFYINGRFKLSNLKIKIK